MERESTFVVVREEPIVAIRGAALVLVMSAKSAGRRRFGECMVLDEGWWQVSHWPKMKIGDRLLTGLSWELPDDL